LEASNTLRDQSVQIDRAAEASSGQVDGLRHSLGDLAAVMKRTANDAARVASDAAQSCRTDAVALIEATRDVNQKAAEVGDAVRQQMTDLAGMSRQVDQLAANLKQTVTAQAGELDQATAVARANSTAIRAQLGEHAAELSQMADKINQRLVELGDDLRQK